MPVALEGEVLSYLDHSQGLIEIRFVPHAGSQVRVGYFANVESIKTVIEDYESLGQLFIGVQPRKSQLLGVAPNRLKLDIISQGPNDLALVNTLVLRIRHDDAAESIAFDIKYKTPGAPVQIVKTTDFECLMLWAIPSIADPDYDYIKDALRSLSDQLAAAYEDAIITFDDVWDMIPLNGQLLTDSPRTEFSALGQKLVRKLPEIVKPLLEQSPRLKALMEGKATNLGQDDSGALVPIAPKHIDDAIIREILQHRPGIELCDIIATLAMRPDGLAKTEGMSALRQLAKDAFEKYHQPGPIRAYAPQVPVAVRLDNDYFSINPKNGEKRRRQGIPITTKAQRIIDYLIDNSAVFYFIQEEQRAAFIFNDKMHTIDQEDSTFVDWFHQHVQLFGPHTSEGRELISALISLVRTHPVTKKIKASKWGAFNREQQTMYFCFDPTHTQIIRIRPAINGVPQVETLPNGTDGVTLLGTHGRSEPFRYVAGVDLQLFIENIHRMQSLPPTTKIMSTAFNLTQLIPDHKFRPIKLHTGSANAGKTTSLQFWLATFYRRTDAGKFKSEQELWYALRRDGPIVVQDNLEFDKRHKFRDAHLIVATGGAYRERVLYKNSQTLEIESNAGLCLTAIEPQSKDEEIRRTYAYEFSEKYRPVVPSTFTIQTHLDKTVRIGDQVLSSLFDVLSLHILPNFLARFDDAVAFIRRRGPKSNKEGYISWEAYMLMFVEAIGHQLWDGNPETCPEDMREMYCQASFASSTQDAATRIETNPIMMYFQQLLTDAQKAIVARCPNYTIEDATVQINNITITRHCVDGAYTIGPTTTSMLFICFSELARSHGLERPFFNPGQLGARLRETCRDPAFAGHGWSREVLEQRLRSGYQQYTFHWEPSRDETD